MDEGMPIARGLQLCLCVHKYNSELDQVNQTPTQRRQDRINLMCHSDASSSTSGIRVGSEIISPSSSVCVCIDADLSMRTRVANAKMTAVSYFVRSELVTIVRGRCMTSSAKKTHGSVACFENCEHGNATLTGIPAHLLRHPQSVLNAL